MRQILYFRSRLLLTVLGIFILSAYAEAQPGYRNVRRNHEYRYRGGGPFVNIGFHGVPYRYYGGNFYRPYRNYYYRTAPPFGIHINVLPYGYSRVRLGSGLFFYLGGVFYSQRPDRSYEVVAPPLGAVVAHIPKTAKVVVINEQTYHEFDGTYYQEEIRDNNVWYKVVGRDGVINTTEMPETFSIGQQLEQLPEGCDVVVRNGQKYFQSPDNVYFQEIIRDNTLLYEVVEAPAEQ